MINDTKNEAVEESAPSTETQTNDAEKYGADYYAEQIAKLKQNTVSKAEFDKLAAENRALAQNIINGVKVEEPVKPEDPNKVADLRKELFKADNSMSNLEYAEKALELRDELIKKGEPDPFLPWGKRIAPTQLDVEAANRVANTFRECIEIANGDSQLFTNELMRRTNDVRH